MKESSIEFLEKSTFSQKPSKDSKHSKMYNAIFAELVPFGAFGKLVFCTINLTFDAIAASQARRWLGSTVAPVISWFRSQSVIHGERKNIRQKAYIF